MLRFLFRRLTRPLKRGQTLFDSTVAEARRPHWYVDGEVPDTIDGRFAMLATVCALLIVRLDSESGAGDVASAALTERFIEAMDAEHREIGLNDPGLGRRVRKLVRSLEQRVDDWQSATVGDSAWSEATVSSVYRGQQPRDAALAHSEGGLRQLWSRLQRAPQAQLLEGKF